MSTRYALAGLWLACLVSTKVFSQTENAQPPIDTERPYSMVENMPQFIGGDQALKMHLKDQLKKVPAKKAGLVIVSFVINQDSTVSNLTILKSIDAATDQMVLKAIEATNGKWIPGSQSGTAVKVTRMLPISVPFSEKVVWDTEVRPMGGR